MSDLAARERAVAVLMSYHPFWLMMGLEVVTQRAVGAGTAAGELPSSHEDLHRAWMEASWVTL